MINYNLVVMVYLVFWTFLSVFIPFGILGDIGLRNLAKYSWKEKPWTYAISGIPIVGPISTYLILRKDLKMP